MSDLQPFTVDDLVSLPRLVAAVPSPDGSQVALCVERLSSDGQRYVSDLWCVPLAGGLPERLTAGDTKDKAPTWRADGSLCFLSDRQPDGEDPADDKLTQVWALLDGGPVQLTDEPLGVSDLRCAAGVLVVLAPRLPGVAAELQRETWLQRKKHGPTALHYTTMPVRFWDHWLGPAANHLVAIEPAGSRDLTPSAVRELAVEPDWDLSPDGRTVVVAWRHDGPDRIWDTDLRVIDVATGEQRVLARAERAWWSVPRFSPDGKRLAALHHVRRDGAIGRPLLHVLDPATGDATPTHEAWEPWPEQLAWQGQRLLATARVLGTTAVFRMDTDTPERLTGPGTHEQLRASGEVVVGLTHGLLHPPQAFVLLADQAPRPLPSPADLAPEARPGIGGLWVEDLQVPSSDGRTIHTRIIRPAGVERPPVLLWIHGGPISHWADWWHWRWNAALFARQGYAVVLPNPTGSMGYGQGFIEDIWNNHWGDQCYRDVMAVADAISAHDDLDTGRVAALGASFGGYMMNWLGGHTDRFRCIVSHAGIYDNSSFHGVTDFPAYWAWEHGNPAYNDLETLNRYSPRMAIEGWTTPTLVIHGEKDYRVPIDQGLALFEALQRHGVESELLVFPDENHWIARPANVRTWHERIFDFLARHLEP